jgi:hypothetical protein
MRATLLAVSTALFLVAPIHAGVHASVKPVALEWQVAALTAQGVVNGTIPETTRFNTISDCQEWGEAMRERIEDWLRGNLNLDWDGRVQAVAVCKQDSL